MSTDFYVSLPDWPPQRLVSESVLAWNLRHADEPSLDAEGSEWPLIRGAILAFLRHRLSDYDKQLCARCEHDQEFRDTLVARISAVAYRRYPWIGKDDPRPFTELVSESDLPFDVMAKNLADMHGFRDHLISAIADLKRAGNHREEIAVLQAELEEIKADIERRYKFLTAPKCIEDNDPRSRAFLLKHRPEREGAYYFHTNKRHTQSHIEYVGFRCPKCQASVARLKQTVKLGQGYKVIVFSCYCMSYSIYCPLEGPARLAPMTADKWRKYCEEITTEETL